MNIKKSIWGFGTLLLFSVILWSCSDSSDTNLEEDLSLVQIMEVKANALTDAVINISESKGFEVIMVDDGTDLKHRSGVDDIFRYEMSITLDDIKGIYDYKKGLNHQQGAIKYDYKRYFDKVDDSDLFIVRLPKEKAMRPWKLHVDEDGEFVNDFVITTTDYNYAYSGGLDFDYLLNSEIEVDKENAGELFVDWSVTDNMNFNYESKFTFTDDYSVGVMFDLDEKVNYQFNLMKGDDILFMEEVEISKSEDTNKKELEYTLVFGNIKIVWNSESHAYVVYRNDVLQEGAIIEVTRHEEDSDDTNVAFCRKGRDIKITFEDGTSIELSELLSEDTLELMDKLFSSMYDMKFVKHIVDKVAREVYYTNLASGVVD